MLDLKKIIEVSNDVENKSNKDLFSSLEILSIEFEKTKSLIIDLTRHLELVEGMYDNINKEIKDLIINKKSNETKKTKTPIAVNEECELELKNHNQNVNNESKSKRFVKPTLDEVKQYCTERKNNIDAERFINYYEANGWKIGKNAIKDWKACVRTWEGNSKQSNKPISAVYNQDAPRDYDDISCWYQ